MPLRSLVTLTVLFQWALAMQRLFASPDGCAYLALMAVVLPSSVQLYW